MPWQTIEKIHQNPISHFHVESFGICMFLINLKSGDGIWWMGASLWSFCEIFLSRSNIRNPVKNPPFPNVSSWSSWWTWRWVQMYRSILMKLLWNFHKDQEHWEHCQDSTFTLCLCLEGHWGSWLTWRWGQMIGSILMNFLWYYHQEKTSGSCQASIFTTCLFLESRRTWRFMINLEMESDE